MEEYIVKSYSGRKNDKGFYVVELRTDHLTEELEVFIENKYKNTNVRVYTTLPKGNKGLVEKFEYFDL
jgi:hypothetical protein